MRIAVTERARVPWQCKSAKGKLILTVFLIGYTGKGNWLMFQYYLCMCGNTSLFSDAFS